MIRIRAHILFKNLGKNCNKGNRNSTQLKNIPATIKAKKGRNLATVKEAPKFKRNNSKVFIDKKKKGAKAPLQ